VRRLLPNAITILRLLLVPVFAWAVLDARPPVAAALLALIAASDALDGYLARRWHAESRLGAALDPLADKLTQLAGLRVLARPRRRASGAVRTRVRRGRITIRPRLEGKLSTLLVFLVLLAAAACLPPGVVLGLALASAPLVVSSAVRYTLEGRRQLG
jgi:cardiolipin synthase